jgi:cytochrome P450
MRTKFPPGPNDRLFGMRLMSEMKSDVLGYYTSLQRDYGDAVSFRTGPYRLYLFFHPDQVRETLVTNAKSTIRLPRVMATFAQWNGNSVLIAEGRQWAQQRKLVQPAFHPRCMEHYGRTMVTCAQDLIDAWRRDANRDGFVDRDVDQAMTDLTLAIICRTMFDADVAEQSAEITQAVSILSSVAFEEMQAPVRLPAWLPTAHNRRKRWAIEVLDRVVWKFIRDHRQEGGQRGGLLSMLMHSEDPDGPKLDDQQVRDEAVTLMLAGHDTTAAAFNWLWYCLARYPDVATRCREEVKAAIGDRQPTFSHIANLPVLGAAIKETLRLYPPAFATFLRQATEDLTIGGYEIAKGSLITVSPFVTQRDSRWFDEPDRFEIDRFLPPRADEIPMNAYFPFGAGPRACIGQLFATTELTLVAATMLLECEVELIPGQADPQLHVTMALRPKDRLKLRWKRIVSQTAACV